jgi:predicted component of type VI protein secretion system
MRFRLRYLHHDLELSEGEFAIGRNASCQLSLDDPLVSRRHALLTVSQDGVTIEDLESRNGVLVNDKRIERVAVVTAGDKILIGSQEMTLVESRGMQAANITSMGALKMTLSKLEAVKPSPVRDSSIGSALGVDRASSPALDLDAEPSMIRRLDGFRVLGGVAEKALALGRIDEAERLLASPLAEVLEASRDGRRIPASLAEQAARLSAKLATATGKGAWVDFVIELYLSQQGPAPAHVIDELYSALRKVTSVDAALLRKYVEMLRTRLPKFGPAERFLFQRIEGLERLAGLR